MAANELFLGLDGNFTLNDVSRSLGKYNLPIQPWDGIETEGLVMGNLYIAISADKIVNFDNVMNQPLSPGISLSTVFVDPGYGEWGMGELLRTNEWANGQEGTDAVIRRVREVNGGSATGQQAGAQGARWRSDGRGWWYQEADGSYPSSQWKQINGLWYYFDGDGYMVTGWRMVGGEWYFLQEGDGDMATGWKMIDNTWYFFHGDGSMAANEWVGGYYLTDTGAMR